MKVWKPHSAYSLGRETTWAPLMAEIDGCLTVQAVNAWWADYLLHRHRDYPQGWSLALREACEKRQSDLMAGQHHAELDAEYAAVVSR